MTSPVTTPVSASVNGVLNATTYGVVCSDTTETATTTASNATVTVGAIGDFKVGQYVKLDAAGAANTLATPTIASATDDGYSLINILPDITAIHLPLLDGGPLTANGYCSVDSGTALNSNTSCSTTYGYSVQNVGQTGIGAGLNGMRSAASATVYVTNAPASPSIGNAVLLTYSIDANTAGTIIRRCTGASCTPTSIYAVVTGIVPNLTWGGTATSAQYRDNGKPYGIDEEAATSAVAADLDAQITAVSGTSVTLSVAPSQSGAATMRHDNSPALQQAVNASVLAGITGSKVYLPACATHYDMAQAISFWELSQTGIEEPGTNPYASINANIRWDGPPGGVVFNMNMAFADSLEGIGLDGMNGSTPGIMIDMDRYPGAGWSQANAGPGAPNSGVAWAGLPPTGLKVHSVGCGVVGLCLNLGGDANDEDAIVDGLNCSTPNGVGGNICVYSNSQETYNEAFYNTTCSSRDYCFDFYRIGSFVMLNTNSESAGVEFLGTNAISNYGRVEGGQEEGAQLFQFGPPLINATISFSDYRIAGGSGPWCAIISNSGASNTYENMTIGDGNASPVTSMNVVGGGSFINVNFAQPLSFLGAPFSGWGGGTSPETPGTGVATPPYFIPVTNSNGAVIPPFTCIHCAVSGQPALPGIVSNEMNQATAFNTAPAATTIQGTGYAYGSTLYALCSESMQGTLKIATCYLSGYLQTGAAQTYTYPVAFSTYPTLMEGGSSGNSCGTYNPTTTATTLTLPANASMTAETCTVTAIGQ